MAISTTARMGGRGTTAIKLLGKERFLDMSKKKSDTPYGDMLLDITQQQQDLYDQVYRPLNKKLIEGVNSTAIVDQAKQEAGAVDAGKYTARMQRQQLRYGLNATPTESDAIEYQQKLGSALTADGNINTARVKQVERNEQLRNELVGVSRGIATQAMDSAVNAATGEGNRNSTNANIRANNNAAEKQTYSAIGSMALMALMMM